MGFYRSWFIIYLIIVLLLYSMVHGSKSYDPESLEAFFHSHANETLSKYHKGDLYHLSLPSNFSGMQASVVRLRSGTFWAKGENFSYFHVPPRVTPMPYAKRIAIVYDNLGNWSSYYYQVPKHSLVAPVVGFAAYDASNSSKLSNIELKLNIKGDPISISFPDIALKNKNVTLKCVKFSAGNSVEFSNITESNQCVTGGSGQFSVVIPSPQEPQPQPPKKKEESSWKWWVLGFVGGFAVLVLVGVVIFKLVRKRKLRKMESESENGGAFDTMWIGRSKLPSASMIRTQPTLEHDNVP